MCFKKMIFALTISVIAIFCSSCGTTMKVAVNPNSSYSKNNPITIIDESKYSEKTGALGELEYLLQSNGYNLMSMDAAKKAMNIDETEDLDENHSEKHKELTHTTTYKSVYVLKMQYNSTIGTFNNNYYFLNLSVTITDLATGELVMTSHFRGNKKIQIVLKKLVQEMNKVIK